MNQREDFYSARELKVGADGIQSEYTGRHTATSTAQWTGPQGRYKQKRAKQHVRQGAKLAAVANGVAPVLSASRVQVDALLANTVQAADPCTADSPAPRL